MGTIVKKKVNKRVTSKKVTPKKVVSKKKVNNKQEVLNDIVSSSITLEDKVKTMTENKNKLLNEITKEERLIDLKLIKINKEYARMNTEIDSLENRLSELKDLKDSLI
jgi:chromosome segregation ATPase